MKDERTLATPSPAMSGAWQTGTRADELGLPGARALADAMPNPAIIYDADGKIAHLNSAGLARAGLTLDQVVGQRDQEVFSAHVVSSYLPLLERAFVTRQLVTGECTVHVPPQDGREGFERVYSVSYTPVLGAGGELENVIGISRDLTETRSLEHDALQFQAVQASPRYAVVTAALNGTILNFNRGAENIYGYRAEEVVGQNLLILFETQSSEDVAKLWDQVARAEFVEYEGRRRHKQGHALDLQLALSPVRNGQGEIVAITELGKDISRRRELERRVLSVKYLETVSRAVSGLAHDLNNALTVVETYTGLVAQGSLSPEQSRDLEMAQRAARRGAEFVGQLLSMHRGPNPRARITDISATLRELGPTLPRLYGERLPLSSAASQERLAVGGDVVQVQQLLLALIDYASVLFPPSAPRVVSTRALGADGSPQPLRNGRPARQALLAVRAQVLPALGVAALPQQDSSASNEYTLLREVAADLGGTLHVETIDGVAAEVRVILPLAEPLLAAQPPSPARSESEQRVVLVAEDDAAIRSAMRRILENANYRVLEAESGSEAERVAAEHVGPIHVIVSDQFMPNGDGLEAIARVRAVRPHLKAILVSGHPDRELTPADVQTLDKPFSNDELVALVDRAASEAAHWPSQPPLLERPVVLAVDSDVAVRESVSRLLAECNFTTIAAASGLHALQVLQSQRIDVVVTEQLLPGMDGVHLLGIVRDRWPRTARVLLTAYPSSDIVLEAVNRGGVHKVLVKSMHPLQIRNEIEASALESARLRR